MNPPAEARDPLSARDRLSLARVPDADLDATVEAWLPRWISTARTILEYGEEGLVDGLVEEQAVAVLLLARQVRRLSQTTVRPAGQLPQPPADTTGTV
ncbi:hypothetical protein ENKNEFLB_02105 [Nocardioides aquaticus]|uniref:RNA polymerase sigma-70 region 2 domain-containing protein n=1 Tax=Nocardioides aquaticus TaxID=160826 RepID=A0ABX8EIJ2_9ACTN|nr:hypothetical protein [Nocardioides aquaticus]QVT79715.1 hypothetical protein ENKNEFLB_02105 [Nocardioides aquaticus]